MKFLIYFLPLLLIFTRSTNGKIVPVLIVHGGAGDIDDHRVPLKESGLKEAIRAGITILQQTQNVLDAVEAAVRVLENNSNFNAGNGSVKTITGDVEMDAIIMNGADLSAGAVGAVRNISNPISLARKVMEKTPHVLLVAKYAEEFASSEGFKFVPMEELAGTYPDYGTVGAVAINEDGNIAVATSTGGLSGKMNGRIGDSPIIGGGSYADDEIAGISATGWGEGFLRFRVASRVSQLLENGESCKSASEKVLANMKIRIPVDDAEGGLIAISKTGDVCFAFNSKRMSWAYGKGDQLHFGTNPNEDKVEPLFKNGNENGVCTCIPSFLIMSLFTIFSLVYTKQINA